MFVARIEIGFGFCVHNRGGNEGNASGKPFGELRARDVDEA